MFFECYKIKKAPDFSGSFNLSQINFMFEKCVSLKDFPNINTDNISCSKKTFKECPNLPKLKTLIFTEDPNHNKFDLKIYNNLSNEEINQRLSYIY